MKCLFMTGFEREREREKRKKREEEKRGREKIGKGVLIVYDRGLHQKMMVMMMQGTRFPVMVVSMFGQC